MAEELGKNRGLLELIVLRTFLLLLFLVMVCLLSLEGAGVTVDMLLISVALSCVEGGLYGREA